MITPGVGGKGCAHCAGRIHAGTSITNGAQVAESDRHADGQRRSEAWVWFVGITGTKNGQHQHQTQEELNAQALQRGDVLGEHGVTQSIVVIHINERLKGVKRGQLMIFWRNSSSQTHLHCCSAGYGAQALEDNVEHGTDKANPSCYQHGNGNSGINVAATQMTHNL